MKNRRGNIVVIKFLLVGMRWMFIVDICKGFFLLHVWLIHSFKMLNFKLFWQQFVLFYFNVYFLLSTRTYYCSLAKHHYGTKLDCCTTLAWCSYEQKSTTLVYVHCTVCIKLSPRIDPFELDRNFLPSDSNKIK